MPLAQETGPKREQHAQRGRSSFWNLDFCRYNFESGWLPNQTNLTTTWFKTATPQCMVAGVQLEKAIGHEISNLQSEKQSFQDNPLVFHDVWPLKWNLERGSVRGWHREFQVGLSVSARHPRPFLAAVVAVTLPSASKPTRLDAIQYHEVCAAS